MTERQLREMVMGAKNTDVSGRRQRSVISKPVKRLCKLQTFIEFGHKEPMPGESSSSMTESKAKLQWAKG